MTVASEVLYERFFRHRHKPIRICVTADGSLDLYVDDCLRKRRAAGREPQYVWTNVELEWEEHHYVEARYWASSRRLLVTVNRDVLIDQVLSDAEASAGAPLD